MVTCEKKVKGKIGIGKLRYGICINYSRKNRYREKKVCVMVVYSITLKQEKKV